MKRLIVLLFISLNVAGQSSVKYSGEVEACYLSYRNLMMRTNPDKSWKGYNLEEKKNGVERSVTNGLIINNRFFAGVGTGYLNFEGISGVSLTGEIAYQLIQKWVSPTLNLRVGYSHIWNQYQGGTGTPLIEPGISLACRLKSENTLLSRTSLLVTQQVAFFATRLGYGF